MKIMIEIDEKYQYSRFVIEFIFKVFNEKFGNAFYSQNIKILQRLNAGPETKPIKFHPELRMDEDFIVYLSAKDGFWCQIIYQLSHELSHVAMECYPRKKELKWISECLCESASIYVLRRSIDFFQNQNYDGYKKYTLCVEEYINDHLEKSQTLSKKEVKKYINANFEYLRNDPIEENEIGRPRNNIIGKHWAEIIERNQNGWSAISLFSEIKYENMDEVRFFDDWYNKCRNNNEKMFVREIIETIFNME